MQAKVSRAKATRREWLGLIVIALPCLLYSMDLTVLNLAVPSLSADLKPSSTQLLWIIDIYGFFVAGSLITMGTLGDRIGRRRLLMIGAVAFGVASILAAFSNSAQMLIATRALLGVAGATIAPSTLSLIRNMFHDPAQRTFAIGIWISSFSAGAAIGPLVGGLLLEQFWWGSVFLISVPVMVLLLVLAPVLLPEYRDPHAGRLDLASAVLSLAAVLPTIYGLKHIAAEGVSALPLACIAAGFAAGFWFVQRQSALTSPLIDLRLFRSGAFSAALAAYTVGAVVSFGVYVLIAQYLQLVAGLSPMRAGLWTVPSALAFVVGSMFTPALARRIRPTSLVIAGLFVATFGFGMLTVADEALEFPLVVTGFVVACVGLAPVFTLSTDILLSHAPPERAGAAAALSETGSEFGGALGIALLGSIGTVVYRSTLGDAAPPGTSVEAWEAARNTLGAALSVSQELPGGSGPGLADIARAAFAKSLQVASAVAAVIVIATAMLTMVLFKREAQHQPSST